MVAIMDTAEFINKETDDLSKSSSDQNHEDSSLENQSDTEEFSADLFGDDFALSAGIAIGTEPADEQETDKASEMTEKYEDKADEENIPLPFFLTNEEETLDTDNSADMSKSEIETDENDSTDMSESEMETDKDDSADMSKSDMNNEDIPDTDDLLDTDDSDIDEEDISDSDDAEMREEDMSDQGEEEFADMTELNTNISLPDVSLTEDTAENPIDADSKEIADTNESTDTESFETDDFAEEELPVLSEEITAETDTPLLSEELSPSEETDSVTLDADITLSEDESDDENTDMLPDDFSLTAEDMLNIGLPEKAPEIILTPKICVIGIGGAGGNIVQNMVESDIKGTDFIVANTDAQTLIASKIRNRIQLGAKLTKGLGAGTHPEIGRQATLESLDKIKEAIQPFHMLFIVAGMGGGTGTGGAPVVAQAAQELGILTVGIVTKPFQYEGTQRMKVAESGIKALASHVDSLLIVPNQNTFRLAKDTTLLENGFKWADDVFAQSVQTVTDLIVKNGHINLDFSDVKNVIQGMGRAMIGMGEASGEDRAEIAVNQAISNPFLDDLSIQGAEKILLNIVGGDDLTFWEPEIVASRINETAGPDTQINCGICQVSEMTGKIRVSIIATGLAGSDDLFDTPKKEALKLPPTPQISCKPKAPEPFVPAKQMPTLHMPDTPPSPFVKAETPPTPKVDYPENISENSFVPKETTPFQQTVPTLSPFIVRQKEEKHAEMPNKQNNLFDFFGSRKQETGDISPTITETDETDMKISEEQLTVPAFLRQS